MAPWRKLRPDHVVRREVQGVELFLPWSHLLPDYARSAPAYGQNLVMLAAALDAIRGTDSGPMQMLDIGANVGDSAKQVIARTGAEVLCVEGDPYWLRFLRMNLGHDARATIVGGLLAASPEWDDAAPLRVNGTTRFVHAPGGGSLPSLPIPALRAAHPEFDDLRLVKSDTDGYDAALVPAVAEAWQDAGPVLFFEWDPVLTRKADQGEPDLMWERLAALGYTRLAIWDNGGAPLGQLPIEAAAERSHVLDRGSAELGYTFWDVAARRDDDDEARIAFDFLVPRGYADLGARWA